MEFLNIGGGELLVIVLLALVLFGPEDIMRMMRTLGRYTRSARDMWNQFTSTMQQEYMASDELNEALEETKNSVAEAQEALNSIKSTVGEITTSVSSDVASAQRSVRQQANESAAALTAPSASAQSNPVPTTGAVEASDGHEPEETTPEIQDEPVHEEA
jgi:sec-independent protein translocase protein TatB